MAARLTQILGALETDIQAHLGVTVTFQTGGRFLRARKRPPVIVWVPTQDVYGPASRSIPLPGLAQTFARATHTRRAGVEAHVWGTDLEEAENLLNELGAALQRVCHGAYALTAGVWDAPEYLAFGEACAVSFAVNIPITDEAPQTVVVTGVDFDPTGAAAGDGKLDAPTE